MTTPEPVFYVAAEAEHIEVVAGSDGSPIPVLSEQIRKWSASNDIPLLLTAHQDQIVVVANSEHHITLFKLSF